MTIKPCCCGTTPKIRYKLPKKKELCNIICPNCGRQSGQFSRPYQAISIWNNVIN